MILKKAVIENLLGWMERNLNDHSQFSPSDIEAFFADRFTIITNGRVVKANPTTYRDYLYGLKSRLSSVKYAVEEIIESAEALITPFIITLNFKEQQAQRLLAISIFKFNAQNRIIEWKEVFSDLSQTQHAYEAS